MQCQQFVKLQRHSALNEQEIDIKTILIINNL